MRGPWPQELQGTLSQLTIDSNALRDNPLDDPHERPLWVYRPSDAGDHPLPSIYLIQGFTGHIGMWRNAPPLRSSFLERLDAAFGDGTIPPCNVVFVDCWTSLGGSQFLNSPATGRYHTYLCDEVVPFVDERFPTLRAAAHRGIAGKSSGGYGAMITPMLRPDLFGGLATHAGDALFEVCYLPEFAQCARALRDHYDGSYEAFLADLRSRPAFSRPADDVLLNQWAMAACYTADADGTVRLPFDPGTGELVTDVWERFVSWDPVRMVPAHADALRGLRGIWIDAGTRDEYYLDLGAEAFRAALADVGVTDVHFELYDAGHGAIEYRYPLALAYLAERLTPVS